MILMQIAGEHIASGDIFSKDFFLCSLWHWTRYDCNQITTTSVSKFIRIIPD